MRCQVTKFGFQLPNPVPEFRTSLLDVLEVIELLFQGAMQFVESLRIDAMFARDRVNRVQTFLDLVLPRRIHIE